jgi:hypothetical protein
MMRTHRRMPAIVTKMPPEKRIMRPNFFILGRVEDINIGMGILRR